MKSIIIFFLAALAMSYANECSEEKAEACVETLLESVMGDASEDEVCKELSTSIDCLRHIVDQCLGDDVDDEVEEGLQELEKLLRNCEGGEGGEGGGIDDEAAECIGENGDYIFECLSDAPEEAIPILIDNGITDENSLTCAIYAVISECFVERTEEKCGQAAGEAIRKELEDAPEEIVDACAAAVQSDFTDLDLLDRKKK